jgi:Flp pilus assembly protein TadB
MDLWQQLLVSLAIFAVAYPIVYLRLKRERDPDWERRWGEQPLSERRRLMAAAKRGERPNDPDEAELVVGSARHQRSIGSGSFASGRLLIAVIVLLAAVAEGLSPPIVALALALVAFLAWMWHRDRVRRRNLDRAAG